MTMHTAGVIATRDQREYIAEAVGSLASQVDEVIVVDDASGDGTAEVAAQAASNVTVLRNAEQLGISRTFTRGIEAAEGELILISGGDDISLPGRGTFQTKALQDPGVSLVSSVPVVIDARGRILPGDIAGEFTAKPVEVGALEFLYFGANFVCAPAAAFRRADYLRFGGFAPNVEQLQDHALWLELAAAGDVVVSDTPLVGYRKHSTNLSRAAVGFDTRRARRRVAERDWLLDRFLAGASAETRMRLAASRGLAADRFSALRDLEQISLIQLNHPDPLVVRRGLARLFDIGAAADGDERLTAMGVDPADIDGLAHDADHENLGAVTRALGLARES